jgi:hypothetical protein
VELGVNDLPRQDKEVVGRHDIIPVITEEWIRLEDVEFHICFDQAEFENTRNSRVSRLAIKRSSTRSNMIMFIFQIPAPGCVLRRVVAFPRPFSKEP